MSKKSTNLESTPIPNEQTIPNLAEEQEEGLTQDETINLEIPPSNAEELNLELPEPETKEPETETPNEDVGFEFPAGIKSIKITEGKVEIVLTTLVHAPTIIELASLNSQEMHHITITTAQRKLPL